jgi:hypothetical protein
MGRYPGPKEAHLTSKGYLELLDGRLGFPMGTLLRLCVAAVVSEVEVKEGTTVTYRGVVLRQKRLAAHKFVQVRRAIFLIEFGMTKAGKQYDGAVQVQLELQGVRKGDVSEVIA